MTHLSPWPHIRRDHRLAPLTEPQSALWRHVHRWRALLMRDLPDTLPDEDVDHLIRLGELYLLPTPIGDCLMLGPAGRARAGQRPDNRSSVDSVMNAAYMARAVGLLLNEGWLFHGLAPRGCRHYLMTDPDGRDWTVLGQARGYSPRTLRRLVRNLRGPAMLRGNGILIFTPDRRYTYGVARRHSGLVEVRHLTAGLRAQRRSQREADTPSRVAVKDTTG